MANFLCKIGAISRKAFFANFCTLFAPEEEKHLNYTVRANYKVTLGIENKGFPGFL